MDTARHITPFISIGRTALYLYLGSGVVGRPNGFVQFGLVVVDDGICRIDNVLGRAIVLLQTVHGNIVVILLKIEDVVNVRPAESIDTLCIVAHHTNILKLIGKRTYNEILGVVGILVLIHQNIAETVLVLSQYIGEAIQQLIGAQQ